MKRIHLVWIGIVLALVAVVSVSSYNRQTNDYTIGVIVPLTGTSASFGERVQDGINLATRDIFQKYSVNIIPLFEDDGGQAPSAVTAANKLININKVHVIIGTVKSDAMLAVAPITEKNQVILFSPTAGAASISQAGDFVFRNIETPTTHGEADSTFLRKNGVSRAAVFIANASNAQGYGNAFINSFDSIGTITATSTYNQNDTDFRTIISKVLETDPQGIFLGVATAKDAALLVTQIRNLGFKGIILSSVATDAPEFFATAGVMAEGTYLSTSFFDPSIEPATSYNEKFKSKYNRDSDAFAANAYDATILLFQAMKHCGGDIDTKCIRDYIYDTKNYPGVSGNMTFDENGDVTKPVAIKIAKDGAFVLVE